jgi:hypothetical protein
MAVARGKREIRRLTHNRDLWKTRYEKLLEETEALKLALSMVGRRVSPEEAGQEENDEGGPIGAELAEAEHQQEQQAGNGEPGVEERGHADGILYPIPILPPPVGLTERDQLERRVKWLRILLMAAEAERNGAGSGERRFDDDLKALGFVMFSLNSRSYTLTQDAFGLPSDTTVWEWSFPRRVELGQVLMTGDPKLMDAYLQSYRNRNGIPEKQKVRVNLGMDATSATATGIGTAKTGYLFVFMMLPHSRQYPDLVLRSVPSETGNLDDRMKRIRDVLLVILTKNDFVVHWKCTDGDTGTNNDHDNFEAIYHGWGRLVEVVAKLVRMRHTLGIIIVYALSDDLHIEKNVRSRGAAAIDGKILTIVKGYRGTTAVRLQRFTGGATGPFGNRRTLDKLSDALAREAFNMSTLNAAQEAGDITSWVFMLPFVCIAEVFRREKISVPVRLGLLEVAYAALRAVSDALPKTGGKDGIFQKNVQGATQLTLWLPQTIKRACNLCVALYMEISEWYYDPNCTYPLALSRFGTHSIECHFGITRGIMKGDARLSRFLAAQKKATLVRHIMQEYEFPEYQRRFRHNEGGITLTKDMVYIPMELDFTDTVDKLQNIVSLVMEQAKYPEDSEKYKRTAEPVMKTMRMYHDILAAAKEKLDVHVYSETSGLGMQRWFIK